jgi:hypothetical protein
MSNNVKYACEIFFLIKVEHFLQCGPLVRIWFIISKVGDLVPYIYNLCARLKGEDR